MLELRLAELLVLAKVEVRPVGNALELAEAWKRERKAILDVARTGAKPRVVGELVLVVLAQLKVAPFEPKALPPRKTSFAPEAIPFGRLRRVAEELELH